MRGIFACQNLYCQMHDTEIEQECGEDDCNGVEFECVECGDASFMLLYKLDEEDVI